MKHYLELVSISAKKHRRQSRMTRLCILLAVALIATIFGMADMAVRSQRYETARTGGSWHVGFSALTGEQEAMLRARPEVEEAAWYHVENYQLDEGYTVEGTETALCGMEENFLRCMYPGQQLVEGSVPEKAGEAAVTQSMKLRLGLKRGDKIVLHTPQEEEIALTVTGFSGNTSMLTSKDAFGIFLSREGFEKLGIKETDNDTVFVTFIRGVKIPEVIQEITGQLGISKDHYTENTIYLGLMGQSRDSFIVNLYICGAVLAVFVMTAGILMIAGSINSSIARRTGFFGMLRCLGASVGQVRCFVLREAFEWCKTAIPAGLAISAGTVWFLCWLLRKLNYGYFDGLPVRGISGPGLVMGAVLGLVTVLLAALAPARKASRVSPLAAVSGNADDRRSVKRAVRAGVFGVETSLGAYHAFENKKQFMLMTGSFAFTVILFLTFSVTVDFMDHALVAQKPYTPDLSVTAEEGELAAALKEKIGEDSCVKKVYARRFAELPAWIDGHRVTAELISYDEVQFEWAKKMLAEGSVEDAEKDSGLLAVYGGSLSAGSRIVFDSAGSAPDAGTVEMEVSGILSDSPFDSQPDRVSLICSEKTFEKLAGIHGYAVIDVQVKRGTTDEDAERIRQIAGEETHFSDRRLKNQEGRGAYYSYAVFIYGFLGVIGMICAFHVINSIAMSVQAREREYGMMRAVGMTKKQIAVMIFSETAAYSLGGMAAGICLGLWMHKILFEKMVTFRWGTAWHFPGYALAVILIVTTASAAFAVRGPVLRICRMSVTESIAQGNG